MKKYLLLITVVLTVAPLLVAGCASPSNPSPSPSLAASTATSSATAATRTTAASPSAAASASPTTTPTASQLTYAVAIPGFSFQPSTLTVPRGASVTWRNDHSVPHTIVSDTQVFSSAVLNQGNTYTYQFNQAGTYPYHCGIHPSMTGTITVTVQ